ncbi:5-oxoprolinase subunit PxpB [Halobacillus fulvus]|nr:5-oxoprolinase subunit PxpB [Halobacillus fulvus]
MNAHFYPLGDQAVTIEFGDSINEESHQNIRKLAAFFDENPPGWLIEYIPAFASLTLFYNPLFIRKQQKHTLPYEWVVGEIKALLPTLTHKRANSSRTIEIPVCYGQKYGPDLAHVAERNDLSEEEVIHLHTNGDYLVYMIGFAPGFPYLGGMDKRIQAPRKPDPRLRIPAGSVGIAGEQTGVYPLETPGGWQLIGQTPLRLFRPEDASPSLLKAGDRIRFVEISEREFLRLKEES